MNRRELPVAARTDQTETETCPECEGQGYSLPHELADRVQCWLCDGRGKVSPANAAYFAIARGAPAHFEIVRTHDCMADGQIRGMLTVHRR